MALRHKDENPQRKREESLPFDQYVVHGMSRHTYARKKKTKKILNFELYNRTNKVVALVTKPYIAGGGP